MKILGISKFNHYTVKHTDISSRLGAWINEIKVSNWNSPDDIKQFFKSVKFKAKNLAIFSIELNGKIHQIVTKIAYETKIVKIQKLTYITEDI